MAIDVIVAALAGSMHNDINPFAEAKHVQGVWKLCEIHTLGIWRGMRLHPTLKLGTVVLSEATSLHGIAFALSGSTAVSTKTQIHTARYRSEMHPVFELRESLCTVNRPSSSQVPNCLRS